MVCLWGCGKNILMFHVKHGKETDMSRYKCIDRMRYWCYKVIPLVYDDSLSYYEQLCKVVDYLNNLIEQDKLIIEDIEQLKQDLAQVQEWIDNLDTDWARDIIEKYIATMIFVEITNSGYIVYNIPERWEDITFNTTGLDINLKIQPDYGHLVLSY